MDKKFKTSKDEDIITPTIIDWCPAFPEKTMECIWSIPKNGEQECLWCYGTRKIPVSNFNEKGI